MDLPYGKDVQKLINLPYEDKGFMSSSPTKDSDAFIGRDTMLNIKLAAGHGVGAYINQFSKYENDEYEYLINARSKFLITNAYFDGKNLSDRNGNGIRWISM